MQQFSIPSSLGGSGAREFRAYPRAAQNGNGDGTVGQRDRRSMTIVAAIACCVCVMIGVGIALGFALSPSPKTPVCCVCEACGMENTTLAACGESSLSKAAYVEKTCVDVCLDNDCVDVVSSTALDDVCDASTCDIVSNASVSVDVGSSHAPALTTAIHAAIVAGSAAAATTQPPIALDFVCSVPFAHNSSVVSFFTYRVPHTLTLPIGAANHVTPGPNARGQPEQFFAPGGSVAITWNRVAHTHIEWTLVVDATTTVRARAVARTAPCPALA